jgi:hypothetical protein
VGILYLVLEFAKKGVTKTIFLRLKVDLSMIGWWAQESLPKKEQI